MSGAQIDHWLRTGRLHRLFECVYLVGHEDEPHGARELGATMAVAESDLAARSAAWLYEIGRVRPRDVELLVHGASRRSPKGTLVRSTARVRPGDRGVFEGIPITSPARTIADCAPLVGRAELESMIKRAEFRGLIRPGELKPYAAWRRPGAPLLRDVLGIGPAETLSGAEAKLLALIRASALPEPQVNTRGPVVPDLLWPEARLIVEIDGAQHGTDVARWSDARRDADLLVDDVVTLRIPAADVFRRPTYVLTRICVVYGVRRRVVAGG